MLEVNAANSKIVAETGEEMEAVEKYMSDIQDISHKFDFITKNGSEKQIFRLIKTLYHLRVYHHQITPLRRCYSNCITINDHLWLLQCQLSKHHAYISKVFLNRTRTCSLPDKNFIQIINTSTMRAEQKIMVPIECYGITLIDNDIVLGNRGVIYII
jgi:hypothetical protein